MRLSRVVNEASKRVRALPGYRAAMSEREEGRMSDVDPRDENEALSLRLAFDTDEPQFARGFEAGRLWQMLESSDQGFTAIMHGPNAEMILRMAEATNRSVRSREMAPGSEWIEVEFSDAREPVE